MPFNGSGVFQRVYNWANDKAAGIKIRADRMDNEMNGFATGLSTCITKDGQTTVTANLPMATFRHTNVGNGVNRTDYAALGQAQDDLINWAAAGGTANAITATYSPAITTLSDGQMCYVRASAANTTTNPTFSPNGLTARTIVKNGNQALVAGDIFGANHELALRYHLAGTRWELLNPAQNTDSITAGGAAGVLIRNSAGTTVGTFGASASTNTTLAGSLSVGTTLGVTGVSTFSNAIETAKGADLASASTVNLGAATGNFVHITGTTTITSFGTDTAGVWRFLRFAGALTLTHNATSLILPTGANITTAANDTAVFVSEGSGNWRCLTYNRNNGDPVNVPSSVIGWTGVYTSAETIFSNDSTVTFTHGLGARPRFVVVEVVCTTAQGPFAVGDAFALDSVYGNDSNRVIQPIIYNNTDVRVFIPSNGIQTGRNGIGYTTLTASNFRLVCRAFV